MTIFCNDNTYTIYYTDSTKGTIQISKKSLIFDKLDVALVGKNTLEYGAAFDENILHLLENFCAPENPSVTNFPDLTKTSGLVLHNPTQGQTWFNSTRNRLYVYTGILWLPLGNNDDIGGNSGVIAHGQQLPRPVSPVTGYQFTYNECSWNVSPFVVPSEIDFLECFTDNDATVTMHYTIHGGSGLTPGYVNYQILGIRNNINQGFNTPIGPSGTLPATNTPTPTPTPTPTAATPTPTISVTPTLSVTPTNTMTPTPTPGIEYYMYSSFNPGTNVGNVGIGSATSVGFANISTIACTDYVMGRIATDSNNVFTPFYNNGLSLYKNVAGNLTFNTSIASTASYNLLDVALLPNGLHTTLAALYRNFDGFTLQVKLFDLDYTSGLVITPISVNTIPNIGFDTGSGIDYSAGICFHNNIVMVITSDGRVIAIDTTGVVKATQSITSSQGVNITSDGTYIYLQSGYNNFASKNPRYIFTYNSGTSTFATSLNLANDGDLGFASGDSYIFSGFNGTEIVSRLWDGLSLSPILDDIVYEVPTYGYHFTYSALTNRLYNPLDFNLSFSKVYSWNGSGFGTLYAFRPEADTAKQICTFGLGYVKVN